jgi:hypothetical protein
MIGEIEEAGALRWLGDEPKLGSSSRNHKKDPELL